MTTVEPITYILDILFKSYNSDSPTGQPFPWMRYAEWLIITPVLLIQVRQRQPSSDPLVRGRMRVRDR